MPKSKLNFEFREKLNQIIGGNHHNYCYQCGSCVAVCPSTRYSEDFNPRDIMLKTLLGDEEELIGPESIIWKCTNCYSCYERCPQDVRPVEVIIALKNYCQQEGLSPDLIEKFSITVEKTGRSVMLTRAVNRKRTELGLEEIGEIEVDELQKIIE